MLDGALLEGVSATIRDSGYQGWVVYVDGSPIFEAVPHQPRLLQPARGSIVLPPRRPDRNTMEWKNLPHDRVHRLELYFARHRLTSQPAIRIDRQPGNPDMRFLQSKLGGVAIGAGAGNSRDRLDVGQQRLGVVGYRVGFWNPAANECRLFELTRDTTRDLGSVLHPCWPAPLGFGIAPWVVGLTEEQVPPAPQL